MSAQPLWGKPVFGADHILTKADLLKMPEDDMRYELYQGRLLLLPLYREYEGNISGRTFSHLFTYLESRGQEDYVSVRAGFDFTRLGEHDTVLAPSGVVVQYLPVQANDYSTLPPLLAVEVVSPSQFRPEMAMKARFYLAAGIKLVWVVWPDTRTIEVWTPTEQVVTLHETDIITGGDVLPGFSCPVAKLFPRQVKK